MRSINYLFDHIDSDEYLRYNDIKIDLYIDEVRHPVEIRSLADGLMEAVHNGVTDISSTIGMKIEDKNFFRLLFEVL